MIPSELLSTVQIDSIDEIGLYLLLRAHNERADQSLVRRTLRSALSASVLPARAHVMHSFDDGDSGHVLLEIDDAVALVTTWQAGGSVLVTASQESIANAVATEIEALAPNDVDERRIEVEFTDAETGNRSVGIDVRPWDEIRSLYPAAVQTALDHLTRFRPESSTAHGRLLLWHGVPGTGKTSAIRALVHAWRRWADAIIVTDPAALLTSGRYLRRTLLNNRDDQRWQVVILEDAESLLHRDLGAGHLAKLLNLSDGLLGQGLRCLFLITTNEPIAAMHPALLRPGRCLANIEFTALSVSESAAALGRPVSRPLTLAELLASRPVAAAAEPAAVGQYL